MRRQSRQRVEQHIAHFRHASSQKKKAGALPDSQSPKTAKGGAVMTHHTRPWGRLLSAGSLKDQTGQYPKGTTPKIKRGRSVELPMERGQYRFTAASRSGNGGLAWMARELGAMPQPKARQRKTPSGSGEPWRRKRVHSEFSRSRPALRMSVSSSICSIRIL